MDPFIGMTVVAFMLATAFAGWSLGRIYEHWRLRTDAPIKVSKRVIVISLSILLGMSATALIYAGCTRISNGGISIIVLGLGSLVIYALFFLLSARRVENKVDRV